MGKVQERHKGAKNPQVKSWRPNSWESVFLFLPLTVSDPDYSTGKPYQQTEEKWSDVVSILSSLTALLALVVSLDATNAKDSKPHLACEGSTSNPRARKGRGVSMVSFTSGLFSLFVNHLFSVKAKWLFSFWTLCYIYLCTLISCKYFN